MSTVKDRRVFISYSSANRKVAEALHAHLDKNGFGVWRDKREIEQDWSNEISDALSASDAMCLLWSEEAEESPWVRNEWLTARAIGLPILPANLDDRALPEPLANLDYIDPNTPDGLSALTERLGTFAGTRQGYDYTIRPQGLDIPFRSNSSFVGRDRALRDLYVAVINDLNPMGVSQVGVIGMGGVGKTQLLIEFAYRFGFYFDHVLWINATDTSRWVEHFVDIAKNLRAGSGGDSDEPETDGAWLELLKRYGKASRILIIMDNVQDPAALNQDFLLGSTALDLGLNILFSSRVSASLPDVTLIELGVMDPAPAYALLTSGSTPASDTEKEFAEAICNQLGFLALAIVLAGSFLKKYTRFSFQSYSRKLDENRLGTIDVLDIPASELATRHEAAVAITFESQWDAMGEELPRHLLILAAQFTESAVVPVGRLGLLAGLDQKDDDLIRPLDDAVAALAGFSLAETTDDATGVRLHPLVRDFVLARCDDAADSREQGAASIASGYTGVDRAIREYHQRGIDEVREDIRIAFDWRRNHDSDDMQHLRALAMLCDKESKGLRDLHSASRRGLMAAQLLYRAEALGLTAIADAARAALKEVPGFRTRWAVEKRSSLFERSIVPEGSWVNGLSLSEDERYVATVTNAGKLDIWEAGTGRHRLELGNETGSLTSVAFLPQPNLVAVGSEKGEIFIWNIETARLVNSWRAHDDDVVEILPIPGSGEFVALCRYDKRLRKWNPETGEEKPLLDSLDDSPYAIAMSPCGGRLYFSSKTQVVTETDLASGAQRSWPTGQSYMIDALCVSPDGRLIAAGSRDHSVRIFELDSLELAWEAKEHSGMVTDIAFTTDGSRIVTGGDKRIIVWDLEAREPRHFLTGHSGVIKRLTVSEDGERIFSSACDGTVRVWNLGFPSTSEQRESERPFHAAIAPNGEYGATVCRAGSGWDGPKPFRLWNLKTGQVGYEGHYTSDKIAFTSDSRYILLADSDIEYGGFDVVAIDSLDKRFLGGGSVSAMCVLPDGRFIIGSTAGYQQIKNPADKFVQRTEVGDRNSVDAMACSPDGEWIASASSNFNGSSRGLFLWRASSGEIIRSEHNVLPRVYCLAVSAGGDHVLIGTQRGAFLWSPKDGSNPALVGDDATSVYKVGVMPSGKRAVTGSMSGELRIWDLTAAAEIGTLTGHSDHISGVCPVDEKFVVTGSDDHTLRLWDIDVHAEVAVLSVHDDFAGLGVSSNRVLFAADHAGNVLCADIILLE